LIDEGERALMREPERRDIVAAKRNMRTEAKRARRRRASDADLVRRVLGLPAFGRAEALFSYLDVDGEVPTRDIVAHALEANKTVCLPYCVPGTRSMTWHRVDSLDGLVKSRMGIWEPVPSRQTRVEPAAFVRSIALVPGLLFDLRGYRLGYGGGFYDSFLSAFAGATVGLCREAQLVESLAALDVLEPHDRAVDMVVTERRAVLAETPQGPIGQREVT
jgi:5-formyltetrahydrofolate cyclo-ligase